MRTYLIFCAIVALACARPQDLVNSNQAVITKYDFQNTDDGGYNYEWESSDGTRRAEIAVVQNPGTEDSILVVYGVYSYYGPDSVQYTTYYKADQEGYQVMGEHIPKSAGVKPQLGIPSAALASLAG